MHKIIGLVPLYDEYKQSYWMLPGYMKVIESCGAVPIMFPLTTDQKEISRCMSLCDGILMTGGHDVDPDLYKAPKIEECGTCCKERDQMESYMFEKAMIQDMPVLGICRGIQFMNVMLGGTLYQDLEKEYPSEVEHHMHPPYDRAVHIVNVLQNTQLSEIIGAGDYPMSFS